MSEKLGPIYDIDTKNLFNDEKSIGKKQVSLTYHNPGSLLVNSSDEFRSKVTEHYQQRSGANNWPKRGEEKPNEHVGIFVERDTDQLKSHTGYLRNVYEQPTLQTYTEGDLKALTSQPDTRALVVPYFNSTQVHEKFASLGADVWGLPPKLVESLKNKVNFHRLVEEGKIDGFEVPDYTVATKDGFVSKALGMLRFSEELYRKHGLDEYPRGLMIRLEESDGNYGSALLRQEKNGTIAITPDGDGENVQYRKNWEDAVANSKSMIYRDANPEAKVVISRFLDLESTPGLSMLFMDGQYRSFGWNGQLQINGSKACVGTSDFLPANEYMKEAQIKYEDQSAEAFGNFIVQTAKSLNMDVAKIRGVANVDVMVPGPLEQELRMRRGQKEGFYIAECNPRWTNFTDAVGAGLAMTGREPTFSNFSDVIKEGIYSIDKYKLHDGVHPALVREEVYEIDQKLKQEGEARILVRMTDTPLGVIFLGNRKVAKEQLGRAISNVEKKVAKHTK